MWCPDPWTGLHRTEGTRPGERQRKRQAGKETVSDRGIGQVLESERKKQRETGVGRSKDRNEAHRKGRSWSQCAEGAIGHAKGAL